MISVSGITKSYGTLRVLDDISLSIPSGQITAIVGPSGAGKTTLLQIMGSLERPDCGTVTYPGGVDLFALSRSRLAKFRGANIGFVFQFHRLLPEFSLLENVEMPALIAGVPRRSARQRAMELVDYLGLAPRASHRPAELSGGECQRAAVARALVNKPGVVLADEPTGSLDSHNRAELQRLFFDLRRDMGQTFVIVTHDESLAAGADCTVHLRDGRISAVTQSTTAT